MCRALSCLVTKAGKVYSQIGLDSHDQIHREFKGEDHELQDTREVEPTFARVEVIPTNNNYLKPDGWTLKIDETITPGWWSGRHENAVYREKDKWHKTILSQINVKEALKPVHPFLINPPKHITEKHLKLLREWASVRDSVSASVWASVRDSVGTSVRDSVSASVWASVGDSVGTSVRDSVWDSVRDSVGDSVEDSVRDSVWAYIGSLFSGISEWKYVDMKKPPFNQIKGYPFHSVVKLWKLGLVPSYDGKEWRLRGHNDARVLWEGEL